MIKGHQSSAEVEMPNEGMTVDTPMHTHTVLVIGYWIPVVLTKV